MTIAPAIMPKSNNPLDVLNSLSGEQKAAAHRKICAELVRRFAKQGDVLSWGKVLFPDVFKLAFCPDLHEYLVSIRLLPRTATEAPRGHAKTAICCFLVQMYQALNEPAAFQHYLNVQATEPKALAINRTMKAEFEENELLREVYGDVRGGRWTDQQFVIKVKKNPRLPYSRAAEVCFSAVSAGQSIRGINYRNRRPDYIQVDDLYDEDDIRSQTSTKKKTEWVWSTLYKALANDRPACFHIQGTAANAWDILEKMKGMDRWVFRSFKAADMAAKTALWEALNSFKDLMADCADMTSTIFNREMQNERTDDSEAKIQAAWLEGWEFDPGAVAFGPGAIMGTITENLLGFDPSIGKTKESDFSGGAQVVKVKRAGATAHDYFIYALKEEKLSLDGRVRAVDAMAGAAPFDTPAITARIEGQSGFEDFVDTVKKQTNVRVKIIKQTKDKLTVLENRSHHFENRHVFISKSIPAALRERLIYQLTTNTPDHDDLRDAVLLCLDEKTRVVRWGPVGE